MPQPSGQGDSFKIEVLGSEPSSISDRRPGTEHLDLPKVAFLNYSVVRRELRSVWGTGAPNSLKIFPIYSQFNKEPRSDLAFPNHLRVNPDMVIHLGDLYVVISVYDISMKYGRCN